MSSDLHRAISDTALDIETSVRGHAAKFLTRVAVRLWGKDDVEGLLDETGLRRTRATVSVVQEGKR